MSTTKADEGKPQLQYLGRWYTFLPKCNYPLMFLMEEFWFNRSLDSLEELVVLLRENCQLEDLIAVRKFGAAKYGLLNYRKGMEWSRLFGAFRRHIWYYQDVLGEQVDSESGLPHKAHAYCCAAFLLEYVTDNLGTDDRGL